MEQIKRQNLKEIIKSNNIPLKIVSKITLFNPGRKEAFLGSYGGGKDKEKGKMYNEINIYTKDGKQYAKNKYGINVFLTEGLHMGTQNFYFGEIDGKYVLVAEQQGVNYYFLENGKQYFPKTLSERIEEGLDDFTMAKKVGFEQLRNVAYTPEIEKIGKIIDNIIENIKSLSSSIINDILDKVNFSSNNTTKITNIYNNKKK